MKNFYQSITEEILEKAICLTRNYINLKDENMEITKHRRIFLFFNNDEI